MQLKVWVFLYAVLSGSLLCNMYLTEGNTRSVSAGRSCPCRPARVVAVIIEQGDGGGLSGQRGLPGFSGGLMQNCFIQ